MNGSSTRKGARYHSLIKYANDVISILNVDGTFREISPSATLVFGWELSAFDGKTLFDFIHPEDIPLIRQRFEEMLSTPGLAPMVQARVLCRDGTYRKVEGVGNNLLDVEDIRGCVVTCHDITDRESKEERLRILANAVEQSPVEILIISNIGLIEYVNPAFVDTTGYTSEEVIGKPPGFLHSEGPQSQLNMEIQSSLEINGGWKGELLNRRKNGELHWVSVSISEVKDTCGNITHYVSIAEDITPRKENELLIRESEALKRAVLQSLPVHLCVLNSEGVIISVNDAWMKFAEMNAFSMQGLGVGENYLEESRRARERGCLEAGEVETKIRQMLDGSLMEFSSEYDCHSPTEKCWFTLYASPLTEAQGGVVIAHINITSRRLAEERIAEAYTEAHKAKAQIEDINRKLELSLLKSQILAEEAEAIGYEKSILLASIPSILISMDAANTITQWNSAAERHFGILATEVMGRSFLSARIPWNWEKIAEAMKECRLQGNTVRLDEIEYVNDKNTQGFLSVIINPLQKDSAEHSGILILAEDITERKILVSQLNQAQRLESIGQLAAGIAHEINTPTQYIGDNIRFLQDAFRDIQTLMQLYDDLLTDVETDPLKRRHIQRIREERQKLDIEYLLTESPAAISEALEGVGRVTKIVQAMKEFSHPAGAEMVYFDLNKAVESTIIVTKNEWKYVAELETDLSANLPLTPCFPGEINQVLLNLIVNAAHAIGDVIGTDGFQKGRITISTRDFGDMAEIRVKDTGSGIPENIRNRVFDPFFTTKEVGKGSGQGLAIAHAIITEKHHGRIFFETEKGVGTTFIIQLPLNK